MTREYIAYEGACFTIEWYFDENGASEALEYYMKSSDSSRRKLLMLLKRMGDAGRIFDEAKFRNEGDKIYTFKPQPDRYLCFFYKDRRIILTNAFHKKSKKLPKKEKNKALDFMKRYERRVREGNYYDR